MTQPIMVNFRSKVTIFGKRFGSKKLVQKIFGLEKFWVQKKFGLEKILGWKNFWVGKNFGLEKIFGWKKFLVEKNF